MKPELPEIKSCTDGNCIFGHPGGMHTNGGCQCDKAIRYGAGMELYRRITTNITLLRQEIRRLRDNDRENPPQTPASKP